MKQLYILLISLLLIGCSSNATTKNNITPKLVIGNSLEDLQLNDQFGTPHTLQGDTYRVVFAFAKDTAHMCNDFFAAQPSNYLQEHHTQFVADVSAAPSFVRKFFIMPDLKKLKHTVLLFEDEAKAAPYRKGVDTQRIVVVYLLNKKIEDIRTFHTIESLQKNIEEDSPMSLFAPVFNKAIEETKQLIKH